MTDSSDRSGEGFVRPAASPFVQKRRGLGRGLTALLESRDMHESERREDSGGDSLFVAVDAIITGLYQPRTTFHDQALKELTQSVAEKGVLQPLLVRLNAAGGYELVAGERRLRASKAAGLVQVPCRVLKISAQESLEVSLLENVQRADLSAIEEAKGYRQLLDEWGYTQDTLSQKIGKSRVHVTNTLRLLTLPEKVQNFVDQTLLSPGHARALVGSSDPEKWAQVIVERGLSVRQVEELVRQESEKRPEKIATEAGVEEKNLAYNLTEMTGLKTALTLRRNGGGVVQFAFQSASDLDQFLKKLSQGYLEKTPSIGA